MARTIHYVLLDPMIEEADECANACFFFFRFSCLDCCCLFLRLIALGDLSPMILCLYVFISFHRTVFFSPVDLGAYKMSICWLI